MIRRPPRSTPGTRRRQRQMCIRDSIEVDITRPLKMRKLHVVVLGQNESLFKITQVYNTFLLRELFITCFTYLDTFFTNFQLDADYPSLIVLGLSQRVVFMLHKMKGKRITQLSHQTVRHVIIGTDFVTEKVAKEVCELSLQFPKASINWSSSLLLSLIHISEPTRQCCTSRMPSSA